MPRKAVYQAFLDRDAVASWLPPETMTGRVHTFGPREGGVGRCVGRSDRRTFLNVPVQRRATVRAGRWNWLLGHRSRPQGYVSS